MAWNSSSIPCVDKKRPRNLRVTCEELLSIYAKKNKKKAVLFDRQDYSLLR